MEMWRDVSVSGVNIGGDVAYNVGKLLVFLEPGFYLPERGEDGGVIHSLSAFSIVLLTDVNDGQICQLPDQIHRDLPGNGSIFCPAAALEITGSEAVEVGRFLNDDIRGRQVFGLIFKNIPDGSCNGADINVIV